MTILGLGPIIVIAIVASVSLALFLIGQYLVAIRAAGSAAFGAAWSIVTIAPVFVGLPLLFFR